MRSARFPAALLLAALAFTACDKDDEGSGGLFDPDRGRDGGGTADTPRGTGLLQGGNPSTTPVQATFGFGSSQLPASVDLTPHFPPIGDQGSYGTCVAWAVGYNFKTAINAIDAGEQGNALADPAKQGSARYLFTAVPDADKGTDCNGMLFDPAFEVMQNKGLATLAEVPYTNLGNCSQQLAESSWDGMAADNKVQSYRRVDGSLEAIKRSLHDKMPVVFGAKLGSAFNQWTGDGVLDTEGTFDPNFQHAYHAMVIAGYDDRKGARGAFRVLNSWASTWGDAGGIWIDYDFFLREMLMKADDGTAFLYIATNGQAANPDDGGRTNPPSGGTAELLAWVSEDVESAQTGTERERFVSYDIYNFGDRAAEAAREWDMYYVYYNAYDANDWGVLLQNTLTSSVSELTCAAGGCKVPVDIAPNSSLGIALFGSENIGQTYQMPAVSGEYFLLLIADAEEEIDEYDEFDNYFFPSLVPIAFDGGVIGRQRAADLTSSDKLSARGAGALLTGNTVDVARLQSRELRPEAPAGNAYTVEEVKTLLERAHQSGAFDARVSEMKARRTADVSALSPTR